MALLDLIQRRKSVRKYSPDPVPREALLKCLEAARLAPSACNGQPWKFIVVDEPGLRRRLCDEIFSGIYSMNRFAKDAPVLVAAVSEKEKFLSASGGRIRNTRYYLIDIGIACEHLILQAAELGIGTCWIGWFNERKLKKVLRVPRRNKVDAVISMGYFEGEGPPARPRKSLEEITAFNGYRRENGI
jgi:nitroreductase